MGTRLQKRPGRTHLSTATLLPGPGAGPPLVPRVFLRLSFPVFKSQEIKYS